MGSSFIFTASSDVLCLVHVCLCIRSSLSLLPWPCLWWLWWWHLCLCRLPSRITRTPSESGTLCLCFLLFLDLSTIIREESESELNSIVSGLFVLAPSFESGNELYSASLDSGEETELSEGLRGLFLLCFTLVTALESFISEWWYCKQTGASLQQNWNANHWKYIQEFTQQNFPVNNLL